MGLPLLLFAGFAIFVPVGIYNDSAQYIDMHIHRDSLYPLFLFALRKLFGGRDIYLNVAVWLQNIFAFVSIVVLTHKIRDEFSLGRIATAIVCFIACMPHIMTPLMALSGLVLSNSIMSEAITFPLFYIFAAYLTGMIARYNTSDRWKALAVGILLSLARGQLMVMLIVWLVVEVYMIIINKKKILIRIIAMTMVFCVAFVGRSILAKTYNLIFNGYFTGPTMSQVSLLTNILYASDYDDFLLIEDDAEKGFYLEAYIVADERQYTYNYAPDGFVNRAMDLEEKHDKIKFECLDEWWRGIHDADPIYQNDYVLEGIEQDRIAGDIIKAVWADNFGRWLYDYLALAFIGFIRSLTLATPALTVVGVLTYIFIIIGTVILITKYIKGVNRKSSKRRMSVQKESGIDSEDCSLTDTVDYNEVLIIRFSLLALLCVCANVFATAAVIMCLSRYMIYVLPLLYITVLLLVISLIQKTRRGK